MSTPGRRNIDRLRSMWDADLEDTGELLAAIPELLDEVENLQAALNDLDTLRHDAALQRAALKFYANPHHYLDHWVGEGGATLDVMVVPEVLMDGGSIARKALAGEP